MRVAIITYVAQQSSRELAEALNAAGIVADVFDAHNVAEYGKFNHYDHLLAYGCSLNTAHKSRLNTTKATLVCIDKAETFKRLKKASVHIPEYTTSKSIASKSKWCTTVVRKDRAGRKAEGMELIDYPDALPHGDLYTEYFPHSREYRVVVFKGWVGVYYKSRTEKNGEAWHDFKYQPKGKHKDMAEACLQAAGALGIDYVGFDVVVNSKGQYKVLEANSGPILCDEAKTQIVKYFKGLK